ncbi:MAG: TolC family protein [Betaproteobacteria bacterium]|nr:TolC family protein [Betaproteobacteria bacterium]
MVHRNKFLGLMAGAWISAAVHAAGQEYALPELERLAIESSHSMMATREQVAAARYAVQSARAFPNPEIEYLAGTARSRAAGSNAGDARSVTLTQPIDLPWVRASRIGAAEAGVQVGEAGLRAFEADLLANIRLRYFEVLRRNAELHNAREDVELMESVRSRIALRVDSGEAPRFELIKVDAEMLNAQKSLQAAGFRAEQARSLLRQSIGTGLPVDYSLRGTLREVPDLPPIETVRQALPSDSPSLARSRAEVSRAERQLELERRQRWPSLAVKGGYDDDPDMRTSRLGVVLTVPLWDHRNGQVGEASAYLARSRHELAAQEFLLDQQLVVAYRQYEIAQAQVIALESGIVKQAESALSVAEAAYRFGERGFLEVLDAQRVFRAARAELIVARYELAAAWVEIERLRAGPGGTK